MWKVLGTLVRWKVLLGLSKKSVWQERGEADMKGVIRVGGGGGGGIFTILGRVVFGEAACAKDFCSVG